MKLSYHATGAGEPLLLLHGLLGSHHNLLPVAERLAVHFQVFALDQRNHGASPHHDDIDYDLLAADVALFIQVHKLGRVHLLGHSMGGKAAMRFAQLSPELLQKLIVVDMSPRAQPPRYNSLLDALLHLDLARYAHRTEVDAALAAAIPDKSIRQFLLKNLGRDAEGELVWKPNIPALHANYENLRVAIPITPQFAGPTLFVRGGRSDYVGDEDFEIARQIFPAAELATIDGAGHWVHAESLEPFLQAVTIFLLA